MTAEKTPPTAMLHEEMIHVHNMFKVGLDNLLKLLEDPPVDDLSNFLGYCGAWALLLLRHHDGEGTPVPSVLPAKSLG